MIIEKYPSSDDQETPGSFSAMQTSTETVSASFASLAEVPSRHQSLQLSDPEDLPTPAAGALSTTTLPSYDVNPNPPPPYPFSSTILLPVWLRQHLVLLAAFSQLKHKVVTLKSNDEGRGSTSARRDTQECLQDLGERGRWGLFVEMAVRRFGLWQEKHIAECIKELPPLDVIMVWCAYLGSPGWYLDDVIKIGKYHPGNVFPDFPLDAVAKALVIRESSVCYSPGSAADAVWKTSTALIFSPVEAFRQINQVPIVCPKCDEVFSVSWLSDEFDGYGQHGFKVPCPSCKLVVTKEAIGVRRLINELIQLIQATSSRMASHLLSTSRSTVPESSSHPLAELIRRLGDTPARIGDNWNWNRRVAMADLGSHHEGGEKPLFKLMSAYVGAERASVDLVPATLRHSTFVAKLQELGWLEPSRWDQRAETLNKAIERYKRYLQLAKECPRRLLVPTLGIDIAWQTHLLLASRYVNDTKSLVGQLYDRDDAVEEGVLSTAFDDTAQRWQSRFKVLYSTSGYLLPDGSTLSRISSRLGLTSSPTELANIDYALPLIYDEIDSFLSHPSERASICLLMDLKAEKARKKRSSDFYDRLVRDLREAGKGRVDPSLVRRAEAVVPVFVASDTGWTTFGPTGYPVTNMGVIASGNAMHARALRSPEIAGIAVVRIALPVEPLVLQALI